MEVIDLLLSALEGISKFFKRAPLFVRVMASRGRVVTAVTRMKISKLIIERSPLWIDVPNGELNRVEVSARVKFLSHDVKGGALFVFDFPGVVDEQALRDCGISFSAIGPYVYFDKGLQGDLLKLEFVIPGGRVNRIGIQLWNTKTNIVLEDVCFITHGGEVYSEHAIDDIVIDGNLTDFLLDGAKGSDTLVLDLLTENSECSARCHAICSHWFNTLDQFQKRHPKVNAGRVNCYFKIDSHGKARVTVHQNQPAMLAIPKNISDYFRLIGDKSRNMISKARKSGYVYQKVDPDKYVDDVVEIRVSNPMRQGVPIPQYFYERPARILTELFDCECKLHHEDFYGIFKDGKLVAYTTIFFYGQLAQVNHILGHSDFLKDGVMNLLMAEVVGEIVEKKPWVKAINYLYLDPVSKGGGTGLFKRGVGFQARSVMISHDGEHVAQSIECQLISGQEASVVAKPIKKERKADGISHSQLNAELEELFVVNDLKSRDVAVECMRSYLGKLNGGHIFEARYSNFQNFLDETAFPLSESDSLFLHGFGITDYVGFLSSGLKSLKNKIPIGSFVIFDFVRFVSSVGDDALSQYIQRRFKSVSLSSDDIRIGFKGGDYVLKGVISYGIEGVNRGFDSLVVLKKVK